MRAAPTFRSPNSLWTSLSLGRNNLIVFFIFLRSNSQHSRLAGLENQAMSHIYKRRDFSTLLQLIAQSQKLISLPQHQTYQTSPLKLSIEEIGMKFSVAILTGWLISCASAYCIDVWNNPDFQGTKSLRLWSPSFLESFALSYLTN